MVKPDDVIHPKDRLQLIAVLFDGGVDSYSVALVRWKEEKTEGEVWPYALGIRWNGGPDNGGPDPIKKGGPSSRGYPTWFVLPRAFHPWILEALSNQPGVDMRNLIWAKDELEKQASREE